jgi:hypothetical protein
VLAVGVAGTWSELALTGGHHAPAQIGTASQDTATPSGDPSASAAPVPTAGDAASVIKADEILTDTAITASGYKGTRSTAQDGTACDQVRAAGIGPAAAPGSACQGYVRGDYVSAGDAVYTSVTVLGYPSRAAARKAAARIQYSDVAFVQPGGGLPAMTPQAAESTYDGKVETVGRFVTVTVSAYADGHQADAALSTPTRDVSFAVGRAVLWF